MRFPAAIGVILTGVGLAACGSTNTAQTVTTGTSFFTGTVVQATTPAVTAPHVLSTATDTATSPDTTSSTQTVTTTQITNPSSGGAGLTTATTAGTSPCVAGDLTLAAVGPNSAPGTAVLGFTVKNTGSSPCHTGGWPGVALYAAGASQPLTTSATRSTSDVLGSTPEQAIVLSPGDEASFRLVLSSQSDGDAGCHTATEARFIAPNDTVSMSATIPDGAEYCGQATISPLEPGTSGTGQ
jgi:hypothetical protein